ncbi:MAG: hypothetical protein ACI4HM_05200 [Ruminococcus sp.]
MTEDIVFESEEITVKVVDVFRWLIINKTDETIVVVFTNVNADPITIYASDFVNLRLSETSIHMAFFDKGFYTIFKDSIYACETEILYKVLRTLKIEDVFLRYDNDNLVAEDRENKWKNEEFYKFLVDEAFVFNEDGSVVDINNDLLSEFKILAGQYEIKVKRGKSYEN